MIACVFDRIVAAMLVSAGILTPIGQAELALAENVARSSDAERARFHSAYVFSGPEPTVDRIEIVTVFRRAVLAGEERLRLGDHMFGIRVLDQAIKPWHDKVTIRAELRFHPQNVLVSVPQYTVVVGTGGRDLIEPLETTRAPAFALRTDKEKGTPIVGATIESAFPASAFGQSMWPVRLVLDGQDVASIGVDFGKLR